MLQLVHQFGQAPIANCKLTNANCKLDRAHSSSQHGDNPLHCADRFRFADFIPFRQDGVNRLRGGA
jgi:hypothetical protein